MSPRIYTTTEAAAITGVHTATLDYWVRTNLLSASVRPAHGSGTRRLFGLDDLMQLRFIFRLRTHGWSLQKIRRAVRTLQTVLQHPNPLQSAVVLGDHQTILALVKTAAGERIVIDALSASGQQVMLIVLEALMAETQAVADQYVEHETAITSSEQDLHASQVQS